VDDFHSVHSYFSHKKSLFLLDFMRQLTFIAILHFQIVAAAQSPELIFHSGFEPNTDTIEQESGSADLIGIDESVNPPNDWENDLENYPNIGDFKIQYQGGDSTMRLATIARDPRDSTNKTLHFSIKEPNVGDIKGRVQGNLYNSDLGIKNLFYSIRLYLPGDFNIVKNAPFDFDWLTFAEFWNNANWTGEDYLFRAKFDLKKVSESTDSLRVRASGQAYNAIDGAWNIDVWEYTNPDFLVPVQKWMTLKIYFVEGDECSGRFILTITPDGAAETVVHDIRHFTHHPSDPAPDGLKHFNPFKLYTSDDLINYVTASVGLLNVFWDDFEIWNDSLPLAPDTCLQNGITFSSQEQIDDFATNYPLCTQIQGDVTIQSGATAITDLTGLSQLVSIHGTLSINSNNELTSLAGLENLDFTCFFGLEIINNPALEICDLNNICDFLENEGTALILNNASGCNSTETVLVECLVATNNENNASGIEIFPNPTDGIVNIKNEDLNEAHLQIMDFTGKLVHQQIFSGSTAIDLSRFSNGVYLFAIKTDKISFVKKVVKN